jgi:23S rRNA G2445 N2-methylase RlmL
MTAWQTTASMLDPACGTGSYLIEVARTIHATLTGKATVRWLPRSQGPFHADLRL